MSRGYRSGSASHPTCVLGVLLVALLVSFLSVGCGGGDDSASATTAEAEASTATEASAPEQDPADFLKEVVNQRALGQHGRVWTALHPFHQAVATRDEYIDCESADDSGLGTEIQKLEVVDQYEEPLRIPGQATDVPSTAVTLRLTATNPILEKPLVVTQTPHAVAVGDEWRWVLTPEDYKAYKGNSCPPPG